MEDVERPYYTELLARKKRGEKLKLQDQNFKQLRELWWNEICYDHMLADLFDVSEKEVKNHRYKLNVKQYNMQKLDTLEDVAKFEEYEEDKITEKLESYEKEIKELEKINKEHEKEIVKLKNRIKELEVISK